MKKKLFFLTFTFAVFFLNISSTVKPNKNFKTQTNQRINFRIKGTGSKNIFVTIGIGSKPGYGACCTGVSNHTTVGFSGEVGDVVYDGDTRRVITKIYSELDGQTIDLYDYY